jgi:hypothetical protein
MLQSRCVSCHGGATPAAGLSLDLPRTVTMAESPGEGAPIEAARPDGSGATRRTRLHRGSRRCGRAALASAEGAAPGGDGGGASLRGRVQLDCRDGNAHRRTRPRGRR